MTLNIPQELIVAKAKAVELADGKIQITAEGGATAIMSSGELKQLGEQLKSLSPELNSKTQALAKSARLFGAPSATRLESAAKVGETLVAMSQKYGLAFTADLAGSYLKPSIEACISEAKKGVLG